MPASVLRTVPRAARSGRLPTEGSGEARLAEARALRREDPTRSARAARAVLAAARLRGPEALAAQAARTLGQALLLLGRPRAALRRLQEATRRDRSLALAVMPEEAECLSLLGRGEEALDRVAAERAHLGRGQALRRAHLGVTQANILFRLDRNDEALVLLEASRRTLAKLRRPAVLAVVDTNRANVLSNLHRTERADRLYRRAERLYRQAGLEATALQVAYNRAYLSFLRGRYEEALRALHAVRARFAALGDERHVALCDLDEAEALLRLGLHRQATRPAERARAVFDRLGLGMEAARGRFFLATAARAEGRHPEATSALHEALRAFRHEGCAAWEAICLHRLAELDREVGEPGRAAERAAQAARRLAVLGFPERAGRAEALLARLELEGGEPAGAAERLGRLLIACRDVHAPWLESEAHHLLARARAAQGRLREATKHALRAARIIERHRIAVPPDEYMAAFLADKAAVLEDAIHLVLRLGGRRARARAFALAEQARSRALLDLLRAPAPRPEDPLSRALGQEAETLAREIDALLGRLPRDGEAARASVAARCRDEALVRERRLEVCLQRLGRHDARAARLRRMAPASLEEVRATLGPDETLVEYVVRERELLTFVVRPAVPGSEGAAGRDGEVGLVRHAIPRTRLRELVGRMRFQLDRPSLLFAHARPIDGAVVQSARTVLAQLGRILLAPVRPLLGPGRIVVVPHGELHGVPFGALELGGRPLLERCEVVVAPSATVYLHCRQAPAPARGPALVLGHADGAAPKIDEELRRVAALLPGARLLRGARATRRALAREAREARVVHLACHGEYREDDPLLSGLRLADGWLTPSHALGLAMRPEVLVLSGCATGRSGVGGGDEPFGLVRAFLHAGATTLLTTLWRVSDATTASFMEAFHTAMAGGASAAAAARTAALAVREREPHPYHWAPFVLVGRPGPDGADLR